MKRHVLFGCLLVVTSLQEHVFRPTEQKMCTHAQKIVTQPPSNRSRKEKTLGILFLGP